MEEDVVRGMQVDPAKAAGTSEYNDSASAAMGTRELNSSGLATYVLGKGADGWTIRHPHTSSRPRQPAGG